MARRQSSGQCSAESFDEFLKITPSLSELTEHVVLGTNWDKVGAMLDLNRTQLNNIPNQRGDCTIQMFGLWLATNPDASRSKILQVLKKPVVGENTVAFKYEKSLKKDYVLHILQRHIPSLRKSISSPIQVSQLLYGESCLNETTLDEMERIDHRPSLDGKRTTLISAIQKMVSNDHRKLKDIVTVLTKFKETKALAGKMMTEYASAEEDTESQPPEVVGNNEDHACDILRKNYGALSMLITKPVCVAEILRTEFLSHDTFTSLESNRGSLTDCRAILLKAVREAIHFNYKNLELFVTVLRKFSETADIGDTIFGEYRKHFGNDEVIDERRIIIMRRRELRSSVSSNASSDVTDESMLRREILFPHNMRQIFTDMRLEFGEMLFHVRQEFKNKKVKISDLKYLIYDISLDLKPQLQHKKNIDAILEVVKRKCNIIDIRYLEKLAKVLNVTEALKFMTSYKDIAQKFQESVSVKLCLGEKLQAVPTPSRLVCETVIFVFTWDPDQTTLQDIKDVLIELEPLDQYCIIDEVGIGQSVVVTCYCPAEYISLIITTVPEKINMKELKEFIVGGCIIWNNKSLAVERSREALEDIGRSSLKILLDPQATKMIECSVLVTYFREICYALCYQPDSITPLARDLCLLHIIPPVTMRGVSTSHLDDFERANTIMSAAQMSVEKDPKKFYDLVEKLSDQGLQKLAKIMINQCDNITLQRRGLSSNIKQGMKILVVGHNGSGKSSLINEMLAQKVAPVGRPYDQTGHNPIEEHKHKIGKVEVTIYDTRGFGHPSFTNSQTMEAIVKIKTVDVVLICHKLYGRVDDATIKELKVLADSMGNDLINLSVLVFTFGDDYMTRCDPEFGDNGRLTDKSKEEIKVEMILQQKRIEYKLKDAFQEIGISKEVTDQIPSCISCGKRLRDDKRKELPTSHNWVDDLWKLCEKRCKPEARSFVTSTKQRTLDLSSPVYQGVSGAAAIGGAVAVGATVGTATFPGIGTITGAGLVAASSVLGGTLVSGVNGAVIAGFGAGAAVGIVVSKMTPQ